MDYSDVILKRHTTRDFTDRQLVLTTLQALVAEAQHAASWANAQPWQVIVATGETLETIKRAHRQSSRQGKVGNADLTVAHRTEWPAAPRQNMATWNVELQRHLQQNEMGAVTYGATQDNLFNAAAVVYLVLRAPVNEWAVYDLGAFSQMLMLSATNRGIQSIPAYELVRYPDQLRQQFHLDETSRFMMGIALGYESRNAINTFRSSRVSTQQIATFKD